MQEHDSLALAREFLRKQKKSLRQRQNSLRAARQEWEQDEVRTSRKVCNSLCFHYIFFQFLNILIDMF